MPFSIFYIIPKIRDNANISKHTFECQHEKIRNTLIRNHLEGGGNNENNGNSLQYRRRPLPYSFDNTTVKRSVDPSIDTFDNFRVIADTTWLDRDLANRPTELVFIKDKIIPVIVEWFYHALSVRPIQGKFLLPRNCAAYNRLGQCVSYDQDSDEICFRGWNTDGSAVRIPDKYMTGMDYCYGGSCETFPNGQGDDGDTLILITAQNTNICSGGTLAYASSCWHDQYDRPVIGAINLCPSSIDLTDDPFLAYQQVATIIHEISHILAFSSDLFAFFRDENLEPLTPRDAVWNLPPLGMLSDGTEFFIPGENVVKSFPNERNLPYDVQKLVTPKALEAARSHFGCPNLNGVELEWDNEPLPIGSHFEKRTFGPEFMTGLLVPGELSTFSEISLAVFEDSGWYKVDTRWATTLSWGKGSGCPFAMESCLNPTNAQPVDDSTFCNTPGELKCSADHYNIGECNLQSYAFSTSDYYYRYFNNTVSSALAPYYWGGNYFNDYCPYYGVSREYVNGEYYFTDCRSGKVSNNRRLAFGESKGSNGRCYSGSLLKNGYTGGGSAPRCYLTNCTVDPSAPSGMTYSVTIGNVTVNCNQGGGTVSVPGYSGTLTCPPIATMCQMPNCTNECFGMGKCVQRDSIDSVSNVTKTEFGCVCPPGLGSKDCGMMTFDVTDSLISLGMSNSSYRSRNNTVGEDYYTSGAVKSFGIGRFVLTVISIVISACLL